MKGMRQKDYLNHHQLVASPVKANPLMLAKPNREKANQFLLERLLERLVERLVERLLERLLVGNRKERGKDFREK